MVHESSLVEQDSRVPLPPLEVANRVGRLPDEDPLAAYIAVGRAIKNDLVSLLGPSWEWRGKRVLDFGCGSGRVLRHFLSEAEAGAELHGCDIEESGIAWLQEHLSPPIKAFVNDAKPPLPFPDGHLNLIWATSVFTHLTADWSAWLLELHRLLSPDGLLIASFLGEGMSRAIADEPWDEDRIGMNVVAHGSSWAEINVLHSPWWIRAYWGRAFEIEELRPSGFPKLDPENSHGIALMRRREAEISRSELERPEGDPREIPALRHNVNQLVRVIAALGDARDQAHVVQNQAHELHTSLQTVISSRSWRLTRPLRATGKAARRIRSRLPLRHQ